jgi:subtilisin family serine protease
MRKTALFAALLVAVWSVVAVAGTAPQSANPHLAGVVIFKLNDLPQIGSKGLSCGVASVDAVLARHGLQGITQIFPQKRLAKTTTGQGLARICQARVATGTDIYALCRSLEQTGQVEYAEPRLGRKMEYTPNDPGLGNQWFLSTIQATAAWDLSQGDTAVTVAIVDCGVQVTHPDLAANVWINPGEDINHNGSFDNWSSTYDSLGVLGDIDSVDNDGNGYLDDVQGWDFAGPDVAIPSPLGDNDPNVYGSNNDHGTHVAGDASAVTDNGVGVSGIGFKCKVLPIKCSYDNDYAASGGKSYIYFGYEGIVYGADNGADVINCSWGGGGFSQYEQDVINYAYGQGSLVVCAAGNDNSSAPHYPSSSENAFSVAATAAGDIKSSFSNYGTTVDVSAPGSSIYSTCYSNTYQAWDGTSMASPVCAGLAALVKSYNPGWSNVKIATQLLASTDNIDALNSSYAGLLGTGRINAYKALTTTVTSWTRYYSHRTDDGNDGILRAGESVDLTVTLRNGWDAASAVTGLISTSDYAIHLTSASGNYGAIGMGDTASVTTYGFTVDSTALPHRALFTIQINTDGDLYTDSFYVQIEQAPVLLVDDDGGATVESYYEDALSNSGAFYNYYDRTAQGCPDSLMLDVFPVVIWSCEWAFPSLDSSDRRVLKHYLNNGGKLYISGQDIGWDLQDPSGNEYLDDPSGCTDFYQNYLKATYLGDNGGTSATGIAGDTLTDNLSSNLYQPGRASDEQFPDYFNLNGSAVYCFNYGVTTNRGGLHWEDTVSGTKLVYTGFGYEAITTASTRQTFMDRIMRWFMGDIFIEHEPLTDTENTSSPYRVTAVITSSIGVQQASLYYNLDGSAPYENKLTMTKIGSTDTFECYIPAQNEKTIQYYIVAENTNSLNTAKPIDAPFTCYSFYAGVDTVPPVINSTAKNTINLNGPYYIAATVEDNIGLLDSIYLYYKINSGSEYPPVKMTGTGETYTGYISLPAGIYTGDTINYYITAVDNSSQQNMGRGPLSGYFYFVTTDSELVSNFDSSTEIAKWDTTGGTSTWHLFSSTPHSTPYSISTRLSSNYTSNSNIILTLERNNSYNLDSYADNNKLVKLFWWQKGALGASDTVFIEASTDGNSWTSLKSRTSLTTSWTTDSATVNTAFAAKNLNDSINFRFRLKSDAGATNSYGWVLDDIYLKVQPVLGVSGGQPETSGPVVFALRQNRPNPFGSATTISYQLPVKSRVSLKVYNVAGQLVRTLVDSKQPAGKYDVTWDGRDDQTRRLAAGVYLYRLEAGEQKLTKKLVMLK